MSLSDLLATTDPMRLHWYSGLLCETFVLRQGKHAFAIVSLYLVKGIKYYAAYSNEQFISNQNPRDAGCKFARMFAS